MSGEACTCGYGGYHEPENTRCEAFNPTQTLAAHQAAERKGADVETVLAAHAGYEWWPMTREFICTCEVSIGTAYPDPAHRAHIAAHLAALLVERERLAAERALRDAAEGASAELINELGSGHTTTAAASAVMRRWLRDRAATYSEGADQ